MSTPEFSVAAHLKKVPTAVRPTVLAARRTVKASAPNAKEIAYQSKPPRSSRMTMFFYRGSELDDGSGLLQGSGKDLRFIRLNAAADAERPAVKRLVRKAFALEVRARSERPA